jgi:ABC-2 type transport system permease protein
VSWAHLQAFLWLRWRLMANHWRRAGAFNAILMMIIVVGLLAMAIPLFAGCLAIGIYAFPKATPTHLLYGWDAMALGFVLFWGVGLLAELQRTETLSLSKFLHLPVSVNAAFLINYLSSLLSLTLVIFAPIMLGFGLALVITKGPLLLVVAPLTAAFLLMVTSLTYQFQGWLASLMGNPRRRRTIIVTTTLVFVLIFQLPSLINFWGPMQRVQQSNALMEEMNELTRAAQAGEIDPQEHLRRQQAAMEKHQLAQAEAGREGAEQLQHTAIWLNRILPIGWLPLGVMAAADGNPLPAALGCFGMTLIGGASLWRAYRTTVAIYQGQSTARRMKPQNAKAAVAPTKAGLRRASMLEMRLRGCSEPVAAIALGGLKSLIRAPESKLMLMTPVLMAFFFGSAIFKLPDSVPVSVRALIGIGAIGMSLFGSLQLVANQFGFDRDGFRVFVLSAVPRRDILLGKNLAFAPLALIMAAIMLSTIQVIRPLRWDHFLSMAPQFVSMFLLFCMLVNLLSIYAPMHIAAGSLKPTQVKLLPVLLQLGMMFFLLPLFEAPTLAPLAIEAALESQGWTGGAPICLILTLALSAAVIFIYRLALRWQGQLLQGREQIILETVTNRAP